MKLYEMFDKPVKEAYVRPKTQLQQDLVAYPNMTFDRGQATIIPKGTEVEIAQGGNNYQGDSPRGGTMKFVATVDGEQNTWFTWNDIYYQSIAKPRKVKEADPQRPATSDRVKGIQLGHDPDEDFDKRNNMPNPKRRGQRGGRYLRRQHGQGNPAPNAMSFDEGANDDWGIGDTVQPVWDDSGEPFVVIAIRGDQALVKDDYGNEGKIDIKDLRKANIEEEFVPYDGDDQDEYPFWDPETGEVIPAGKASSVSFDNDEDEDDDDDDFEMPTTSKSPNSAQIAQAYGMFGDIAAGGGDPIDYLITNMGLEMGLIDSMAQDEGYADANEWAQSYQEMESIVRTSNMINKRN